MTNTTNMKAQTIEHAQQPASNRIPTVVRPANQIPRPPASSQSRSN